MEAEGTASSIIAASVPPGAPPNVGCHQRRGIVFTSRVGFVASLPASRYPIGDAQVSS